MFYKLNFTEQKQCNLVINILGFNINYELLFNNSYREMFKK